MSSRHDEPVAMETAEVGEILHQVEHRLERRDLVVYAQASGDHNPIHQDEDFARTVGLPNVIAHGMLTMGLAGSAIEAVAGPRPILSFGTRFAAPVVVSTSGVELVIEIVLASRDETARTVTLDAAVSAQGTKVLSRTRAVIQLD